MSEQLSVTEAQSQRETLWTELEDAITCVGVKPEPRRAYYEDRSVTTLFFRTPMQPTSAYDDNDWSWMCFANDRDARAASKIATGMEFQVSTYPT